MCLTALFFGASVFATNLPALADFIAVSTTWSGIVTIPILVVAYVVGVLAIAVVEGVTSAGIVELDALQGLAAQRFSQLEQEAEILSGSVIGFLLLAAAACSQRLGVSGLGSDTDNLCRGVLRHRPWCVENQPS